MARIEEPEAEVARLREDAASTRTLASMTDRDVAELQTTMRPSAHRRGRFSLACRPNPATHEAVGYAMTDHLWNTGAAAPGRPAAAETIPWA